MRPTRYEDKANKSAGIGENHTKLRFCEDYWWQAAKPALVIATRLKDRDDHEVGIRE